MFGLLKRGEKVFVTVVPDCSREPLMPVIKGLILEQSTIYTDGWRAYDGLVLNGYEHYRVFHSENEFARGKSHVNGIENFWSFAKRRLAKFNGCSSAAFVLHLKECEWALQLQVRGFAASYQEAVADLFLRNTSNNRVRTSAFFEGEFFPTMRNMIARQFPQ